ncbi:DUF721 domain-containing protein [Jonesia quinghaiensis]|uniref:DUF721 domain-containing protein n=1 Tax=Jonesia quinghaiensis TaxID=262806 RepID=UPI0009FE0BE9|nr:DciA family protein [Jonesia quinghaiensis]
METPEDLPKPRPRSVAEVDGLMPPSAVAKLALNRAQAAARSRGLHPTNRRRADELKAEGSQLRARRDPQLFGETLGSLLSERGWNADVAVGGVLSRWPEIVGKDIADNSTAESFDDGILRVRAHSTAWATQLKFLTANILAAIAKVIGDGVVIELKIVGPDAGSFSRGRLRVKGPGARDTWG